MAETPIQLQASKWVRGVHDHWLYQKGGGGSNTGPTSKRAKRFYPGRALRDKLGKHGLIRQTKKTSSK